MNPLLGAFSEERAPFSGTSFYRRVDDGKEVEVTMVTDDLQILEQYLKSNKDAVPVGQLLRSSHRGGKHGRIDDTKELSVYADVLRGVQDTDKPK